MKCRKDRIIQSGLLVETPKDKHDQLKNVAWEKADQLVKEIEGYQMSKQLYGAMDNTERTDARQQAVGSAMQQYRMFANAIEEALNAEKPAEKRKEHSRVALLVVEEIE